ncbi:MAG: 5'-methylthioadenosine/S-adenosylhomocysteine nucleosidase [Alphaproteobacteria bacterium]|jgi:adenosylhomocysteine nucleosidase|nr:5'-methylthioadenosine/S-adenosylhomocysteine nucleosidase [Alphaproteobacteria bacterium]
MQIKIGIVIAMEEEFQAISSLSLQKLENDDFYKVYTSSFNKLKLFTIISKIGKSATASATTHLINKYDPNFIINLGSAGGVNSTKVGSIILSTMAGYYDVDATAFGYKLGQIPQQNPFFKAPANIIDGKEIISIVKQSHPQLVMDGFVITGDSFVADKNKVDTIKNMYTSSNEAIAEISPYKETLAIDMEAASFLQTCYLYNKDSLLIKKISDMADSSAKESFKTEINKMSENTAEVVKSILNYFDKK